MSGNGNDGNIGNSNNGGSDDSDRSEVILAAVALVVSLIALVGTVAQVLQQYYASAAGFTNCGENVMGEWHKTSKRIFRPTELRFEVQFDAPVIFVCPPENTNGPVKKVPITFVTGTEDSLRGTRTLAPEEEKQRQPTNKVHTADNERATWVTLLSQLHTMESASREWQEEHYPGTVPTADMMLEGEKNPELRGHSLAVAIQAKTRSWDNMPVDVKKPYATTTICHLLEIAAMMGIYWKEWDRSKDRYRAEGNGFILTGTTVTDLGLMFTFQISGGSRFQENRVIPVDDVKELCCGSVSTIFRARSDVRRLGIVNEDPRDLGMLQLGSMNEIAETMVLMNCNTITASYFRQKESKHTHLFPVPLELVGMLCKSLHIKKTPFRMLPNPTPYHWDKNFFNMRKLINEYYKHLLPLVKPNSDAGPGAGVPGMEKFAQIASGVVDALAKNKEEEKKRRTEEKKLLMAKEAMLERAELEKKGSIKLQTENGAQATGSQEKLARSWTGLQNFASMVRQRKPSGKDEESQTPSGGLKIQVSPAADQAKQAAPKPKKSRPGYNMELLDALHDAILECDKFLSLQQRRGLVRTVLREHFQEVLKMLNGDDDDDDDHLGEGKKLSAPSVRSRRAPRARKFEELSVASPEERQKKFMDIYFGDVLHEVKKRAASSLSKLTFYDHHDVPPTPTSPTKSPFLRPQDIVSGDVSDAESVNEADSGEAERIEPDAASIWCVLVFRMLCWLTLHDFNRGDLQISKSELVGSRLPVYIS
ncbi:hypothetical protein B0T16DRAFT_393042 [Cercophora newfieldiana]|uniref:Modin n=1 Tax=Cercophora newfieldiana TaxID=92897 RepID=A0AA39XUR3_9PEZI|nr:hypothetical protein B0T16DRAFT_393042 [Cercophora newfieldiana]